MADEEIDSSATEVAPPKERKHFRIPRFYFVLGVILLAFVAAIFLRGKPASNTSLGHPPKEQAGNPQNDTSTEANKIIKRDKSLATSARHSRTFISQGHSFFPTLTHENSDLLDGYSTQVGGDTHGKDLPSGDASSSGDSGRHPIGQTNASSSSQSDQETMDLPPSPQEQKKLLAAIKREMGGQQTKSLPGMLTVKGPSKSVASNSGEPGYEAVSAQTGSSSHSAPTTTPTRRPGKVLAHAGQLLYAVNDLKADSNGANFVQATVDAGRFSGAVLQGSFRNLKSDRLELIFTTLSWRNHTYRVKAIGVNPNSPQVGLASEVDHHYLERFGGMFLTSALSAVGQSLQQQGTTASYTLNGTTQTTVPTKTPLQMGLIGLGGVANGFSSLAQKAANTGPTVILAANTPIGILFRSDWTSSAPPKGGDDAAATSKGPSRLPYLPPANQVFSGD